MKSIFMYKALIAGGFGLALIFGSIAVYLSNSNSDQAVRIEQLEREVAELKQKTVELTAQQKSNSLGNLNAVFFGGAGNMSAEDNSKTFDTLFNE